MIEMIRNITGKIRNAGNLCLLFLLCASVSWQLQARDVYVTATGGIGNGDGTASNPVSFERFQSILSSHRKADAAELNVYFSPGTYNMNDALKTTSHNNVMGLNILFDKLPDSAGNVVFDGKGSGIRFFETTYSAYNDNQRVSLTLRNITIQHFVSRDRDYHLITMPPRFTLTMENVIVDGCGTDLGQFWEHQGGLLFLDKYDFLFISGCTFRNCEVKGNGKQYSLIQVGMPFDRNNQNPYQCVLEVEKSSFYNNRIGNADASGYLFNLLNLNDATLTNNTFSSNIVRFAVVLGFQDIKFINNTVYMSGVMYFATEFANHPSVKIANNIIVHNTGYLTISTGVTTNYPHIVRNIVTNNRTIYYQENWHPDRSEYIHDRFYTYFNGNLTVTDIPGRQYHQVLKTSDPNHLFFYKVNVQQSFADLEIDIKEDQLGIERPRDYMSLGAINTETAYEVSATPDIWVFIGSIGKELQRTTAVDLENYIIKYPYRVDRNSTLFELQDSILPIGKLSIENDSLKFAVRNDDIWDILEKEGRYPFHLTISNTNDTYPAVTTELNVQVVDMDRSPAYIAEKDLTGCFASATDTITFTSKQLYRATPDNARLYARSIPLAGDLNGDGYPELIGMLSDGLQETYKGICIFNGQTGEAISELPFPFPGNFKPAYTQGAPSSMALIKCGKKNGGNSAEIIMALPPETSGNEYGMKVVAFRITYDADARSYSWELAWKAAEKYSPSVVLSNPIPQVVDLDGDAVPEVIVYNKIYNAETGALLLELENLGENDAEQNAFVGCDHELPDFALRYTGYNYVYDMDNDHIYDIVAGGKVYKITKRKNKFDYQIVRMSGVPDGRTGVADITGDGKPDVVTARMLPGNRLRITVWTPGFQETGGSPPQPSVIASRTVQADFSGLSAGYSYIHIGDIDGYEYMKGGGAGRKIRLPEIAVLTGAVRHGTGDLPRHTLLTNLYGAAGGIPETQSGAAVKGNLFALTYDADKQDLCVSFLMEHDSEAFHTGFTMFDFDNDGVNEVCFRHDKGLRIMKATVPFIPLGESRPEIVTIDETIPFAAGGEYPVIADMDNDASADILLLGNEPNNAPRIYAISAAGDKFAPALPVWNQFMYSPFKVSADLTPPAGPAKSPVAPNFTYRRNIKNRAGNTVAVIDEYRPFNGTLLQHSPYTAAGFYDYMPVVYLTEAYLVPRKSADLAKWPVVRQKGNLAEIELTIGNHATAKADISLTTPVMLYEGAVSESTPCLKKRLGELTVAGSGAAIPSAVKAGEEVRIVIEAPNPDAVYYIRLGDDSGTDADGNMLWRFGMNSPGDTASAAMPGVGVCSMAYRDCDWSDQSIVAGRDNAFEDAATVQEYQSVEIDVFANDILPPSAFAGDFSLRNAVSAQPLAGALSFAGRGESGRVIYRSERLDNLIAGVIDTFAYRITFRDTLTQTDRTVSAGVYIYVLQSGNGGFAACAGSDAHLLLKPIDAPAAVGYRWYEASGNTPFPAPNPSPSLTLRSVRTDTAVLVQPVVSQSSLWAKPYPKGQLTIFALSGAAMRWTGAADTEWKNPSNWAEVKQGYEKPAACSPAACTDVVISGQASRYPELRDSSVCRNIKLEDRAMITNTHLLAYNAASVEISLKPMEKNRFVMWSAPLTSMYSGDYHYRDSRGNAQWGDVYMNLFRQANSGGGSARANTFTTTFGQLGEPLALGKAFNLNVLSTSVNRDKPFVFPQNASSYTDANRTRYPAAGDFDRTDGSKFITHHVTLDADGAFDLPVEGDAGYELIQAVNPYLAFLDIRAFLAANSDKLASGYKIWNGDMSGDFIDILYGGDPDRQQGQSRIVRTAAFAPDTGNLIPPLQSFFVVKKDRNEPVTHLKMSPYWTTTSAAPRPYILRNAADAGERDILRIKASQGDNVSYALLYNAPGATPLYNVEEDMPKLFYDQLPLSVYLLAAQQTPLAIHTSGDYTWNVDLGLRIREAGDITLNFARHAGFGYDVYLIDRKEGRETDLQKQNSYTFHIGTTPDDSWQALEINDRFSLRFERNFSDAADGNPALSGWNVSASGGRIHIQSAAGAMDGVRIYNMKGETIYGSDRQSVSFSVPVERMQPYIVRTRINGDGKFQKVFVN